MTRRPNVLWILCDQLRWHALSGNGEVNVATPNLDRLAGEGVSFDTTMTPCPVCTPARAGIVTGQYPHTCRVPYLGDLLLPSHPTAARAFAAAGYRTSYVGKWHLASAQNPFGHNEGAEYWVHPLLRGGFEDWFGFELSNHFWQTRYCTGESMWPPKLLAGYQTDGLTDLSLAYLADRSREPDRPWFHVLSVEAPHHGRDDQGVASVRVGERKHTRHPAPAEYEARFRPESIRLRGNVPESHHDVARSQQAQYCAQVANLDDNVGRVLASLDEAGLAENTLVCFFSDHGELGGSHGRFQKCAPYDESARVPLLARLPAVLAEGRRITAPASLVDIFPTCAAICGVPVPAAVQGLDLSPAARADATGPPAAREAALMQWFGNPRYHPRGEPGPQWRGIRTERYTYAVHEARGPMLFDNHADPLQMDDLHADPAAADLRRHLHALLRAELSRAGEPIPPFVPAAV